MAGQMSRALKVVSLGFPALALGFKLLGLGPRARFHGLGFWVLRLGYVLRLLIFKVLSAGCVRFPLDDYLFVLLISWLCTSVI